MDLVKVYDEYKRISNIYMDYVFELAGSDLGDCSDEKVLEKLKEYQRMLEDMKIKADVLEVDETNANNLQDLKYLIMDALFASLDLTTFYSYKEVERFKMRAVNFVNKRKRAELFNESRDSQCRVEF